MQPHKSTVLQTLRGWLLGILILASLVLVVTHVGELQEFIEIIQRAEPVWLVLALMLQFGTYLSVAAVWSMALRSADLRFSVVSLIPLGIAKLFSDQAMPSGGMAGTAFFIAALNRRGVPSQLCMGTLLLGLFAHYGSYLIAALATLLSLYLYHAIHVWILLVIAVFSSIAVVIPTLVLWLRGFGRKNAASIMRRLPGLNKLTEALADAPDNLLRSPRLVLLATLMHTAIFVLDTATLWVMLQVVNTPLSFWAVLPCFGLASMMATIGPIPLGLGSFEATCVGMLRVMGVPLEAALAATLLLRGFTLWLPMLPGMWLARRLLR